MAMHKYLLHEASHRSVSVLLRERRFLSGDKVTGKVRINVSEPLDAYCIFILLRGEEKASEGFHAVGGGTHEHNVNSFLLHRQYVVPAQEPAADIQLYAVHRVEDGHRSVLSLSRGSHLYDFSVDLPRSAPATFMLDAWASVRYTITAYLQLAGKTAAKSDFSDAVEITIVGQGKEALLDRLKRAEPQQGTAVAHIGFSSPETVKLQVKVEKDMFVMGEEAKMKLIINNHSSRPIKQVTVALHQRLSTVEQQQSREVLLAVVTEKTMPMVINSSSGFEAPVSLVIPSPSHRVKFVCCPSLVGRLFRLEHFLVVTVFVAGMFGIGSTEVSARLAIRVLIGNPQAPPVAATVVGFEQNIDTIKGPVRPGELYAKTITMYTVLVKNGEQTWKVSRRYSEFDQLRRRLTEEFDSVPPLPPKRPLAKVDPSFLVERQEGLDAFVRRITRHPDMSNSHALLHFLGVEIFNSYTSSTSVAPAPSVPVPLPAAAEAAAQAPVSEERL